MPRDPLLDERADAHASNDHPTPAEPVAVPATTATSWAASNDNAAADLRLDQHRTKPVVAERCHQTSRRLTRARNVVTVGPSAGARGLSKLTLDDSPATDGEPGSPCIATADRLQAELPAIQPAAIIASPIAPPGGGTVATGPSAASPKVTADEGRAAARARDQFYTRPDVAATCWSILKDWLIGQGLAVADVRFIEPSAGAGAFFTLLPDGSIGVDIEPKCAGVLERDFLGFTIQSLTKVVAVGNPPFGRQAAMAKRFFAHLASHPQVEVIAFILPRSFRKLSVQRKLDLHFHPVLEWQVPADAFLFQGRPFDQPAVFMIWARHPHPRELPKAETEHPDFAFVPREAAKEAIRRDDGGPRPFAIQRVGNAAGTIHHDMAMSESSHLFVQPTTGGVEATMRGLQPEFRRVSRDVAGGPSIASSEIVAIYRARTGR